MIATILHYYNYLSMMRHCKHSGWSSSVMFTNCVVRFAFPLVVQRRSLALALPHRALVSISAAPDRGRALMQRMASFVPLTHCVSH
jgi:hypothetical protein